MFGGREISELPVDFCCHCMALGEKAYKADLLGLADCNLKCRQRLAFFAHREIDLRGDAQGSCLMSRSVAALRCVQYLIQVALCTLKLLEPGEGSDADLVRRERISRFGHGCSKL